MDVSGVQTQGQLCSRPLPLMKSCLAWLLSRHRFGLSSRTHVCEGQRVWKFNHPGLRRTLTSSHFCRRNLVSFFFFFLALRSQKCLGNVNVSQKCYCGCALLIFTFIRVHAPQRGTARIKRNVSIFDLTQVKKPQLGLCQTRKAPAEHSI